jgi:nicotinamidase-related amidase
MTVKVATAQTLNFELRFQQASSTDTSRFHRLTRHEQWDPAQTAVIICDMWDSHHCVNAVRRVAQIAPRIDAFCGVLRERGVTIIHAPSSCMAAYEKHPARLRAQAVKPAASMPPDIASWCDQIPSEEAAAYPVDQSAGGEDDDPEDHRLWAKRLTAMGRNPRAPWLSQTSVIGIDDQRDYISDSGTEIWSILEERGIHNVVLVGVHTNMCVLGRPFGLRRLASGGKNVVLARDLTDTMYDPQAWPYASHFTGTELVVSHVERYVCPTISSNQVLGGQEFRFAGDKRPRLVMLLAEDEYETEKTLPAFAAKHLSQHFSVIYCYGSDSQRNEIVGVEQVASADALLVSVRRRALPAKDLELIKTFVARAKPVIGIRTASHAFSLRDTPAPAGLSVWPEFDAQVFGGNYTNHFGNSLTTTLALPTDTESNPTHPILQATAALDIQPRGSLYKTSPLAAGSHVLLLGSVPGEEPQPVAWTTIRSDGGRSFYTSLGHPGDFEQPAFEALLSAGIHWACGLEPHTLSDIERQNARYAAGHGRQR